MAWETSDRRERLPSNWSALVKQVKVRDGGRCTWKLPSGARCPRAGTDVDHRRPGDDHSLRNLQLLCRHHHDKKTAREAWMGKRAARKPRQKRVEKHPGLR
jgi:5-methylcytosine-specific restriction endonuclease McrA